MVKIVGLFCDGWKIKFNLPFISIIISNVETLPYITGQRFLIYQCFLNNC